MFRYFGVDTLRVCRAFSYKSGRLILEEHPIKTAKKGKDRKLIEPPKTCANILNIDMLRTKKQYLRGSPSPLTRLLGNLHIVARPLRQALYSRFQLDGPIQEEFPVWNSDQNKVEWSVEMISPDPSHLDLLEDPQKAIAFAFQSPSLVRPQNVDKNLWWNHEFAMKMIVFEIVCTARNTPTLDLIEKEFANQTATTDLAERQPKIKENRRCINCSTNFVITESEFAWFQKKNFTLPKRCKSCRAKKH